MGTRLAIYLVYRASANNLTKAENTIAIIFNLQTAVWVVLHVNVTFALSFPFHELHLRSMQIYEKLILHLQIKIDGRTTSRSFFKYKFSKQTNLFCLKNNFIVTSRKQRCLQATQKLDRFFEAKIFHPPQIVFHRPVDKI